MKRILNPKLKKEKITVIQDSSSEDNEESEENLGSQQDYIQEDYLISPEPVQVNHEVSEEKVTPIMEQGMTSRVSFAKESRTSRKKI